MTKKKRKKKRRIPPTNVTAIRNKAEMEKLNALMFNEVDGKSYVKYHPNLKAPPTRFYDLEDEQQKIITTIVQEFVSQTLAILPPQLSYEQSVQHVIDLLEVGLLRIFYDEEKSSSSIKCFSPEKGKYLEIQLPTAH